MNVTPEPKTARTNMYMSHTIRMIDVLSIYPRCNSLLAHSTCLSSTIVIMYTMLLLTSRWIDLWCFEHLKSLLWSLASAHTTPLTKFRSKEEKERDKYLKFHANDEILWSVMTWIPHPKESSDMSTQPKCDYDLNGTHKNRYAIQDCHIRAV